MILKCERPQTFTDFLRLIFIDDNPPKPSVQLYISILTTKKFSPKALLFRRLNKSGIYLPVVHCTITKLLFNIIANKCVDVTIL